MGEISDKTIRIAKEVLDKLPEYMSGVPALSTEEDRIWITVQTVLSAEQAFKELSTFDDEWLSDKYVESNGKVNVGIRFM